MSLAESTTAGRGSIRGPLDEESREWLRCLAGTGRDARGTAEREQALARLHELVLRAARAELRRRSGPDDIEGRERDDLAHQAADDALLAITSKLDRFLRTDPRDVGCERAMEVLDIYVDAVLKDGTEETERRYPGGAPAHLRTCAPARLRPLRRRLRRPARGRQRSFVVTHGRYDIDTAVQR